MLNEPLEERYNELLRKRIALEGEIAMMRRNHEAELRLSDKRSYRYLWLLLILPLTTLLCQKKIDPSVYDRQIVAQRDSIQQLLQLKNQMETLEKTTVRQVKYVIKEGDDLAKLGLLFFNDLKTGYQIGKDNNLYSDYQHQHLIPGDTLLINFR
jgi:hypothetical protein